MDAAILIFIVEDDVLTQGVVADALTDAGFAIATATTAEDAVPMLEAAAACRALVTDVNLAPGKMTGWDVARRARELSPEVAVVYMTGADGADWASHGVPNSVLVQKPFAPAQIVTAVAHLLNQASTQG